MGTDITFDKLKALAQHSVTTGASGSSVAATSPPAEDKILQYASKINELLRTGNEIVTNISNMKNNMKTDIAKSVIKEVSPASSPAVYENSAQSIQSVSSEKVFNDIKEMIKMVVQFKGDMTLTQASELLDNNAMLIKGFLKERGYS